MRLTKLRRKSIISNGLIFSTLSTNIVLSNESTPKAKLNIDKEFFRKSNPRVDFHLPGNGSLAQDDEIPDERVIHSGPKNILIEDTYSVRSRDEYGTPQALSPETQAVKSKYSKFFNCQPASLNKYVIQLIS